LAGHLARLSRLSGSELCGTRLLTSPPSRLDSNLTPDTGDAFDDRVELRGPVSAERTELFPAIRRIKRSYDERRRVRRALARLGVEGSQALNLPVWILGVLLAIAFVAGLIGVLKASLSADGAVALVAVVLTLAGLLVALLQWRNGLAEKAFDALYARIALANKMRLEAFQGVETDEEALTQHEELYKFYVFTEIDSLEYALRRYRSGLGLRADIVERAVDHFRSRCKSPTFRNTAKRVRTREPTSRTRRATVNTIVEEESKRAVLGWLLTSSPFRARVAHTPRARVGTAVPQPFPISARRR